MDIKKMLEAQKELDKANMEKGGLTEYPLDMVQTAYRVELGELLQEWKQFKFWKLNKGGINRDKMLEEWADCMHFALSLGNYVNGKLQITPDEADCKRLIGILKKKPEQYNMYDMIDKCFDVDIDVLSATIGLGIALGYTLEELEQAYWKKNKINWERIERGILKMKLLVREKVRDILTLAMLKDKGNYNIQVSYMFKNLRVTVHYNCKLVFDKKIDLLDNNVEEELEETIFQLKSLMGGY